MLSDLYQAFLDVRSRLADGWHAWVQPGGNEVWARQHPDSGRLEQDGPVTPPEGIALDAILRHGGDG